MKSSHIPERRLPSGAAVEVICGTAYRSPGLSGIEKSIVMKQAMLQTVIFNNPAKERINYAVTGGIALVLQVLSDLQQILTDR